jgi:hypothetical protein
VAGNEVEALRMLAAGEGIVVEAKHADDLEGQAAHRHHGTEGDPAGQEAATGFLGQLAGQPPLHYSQIDRRAEISQFAHLPQ